MLVVNLNSVMPDYALPLLFLVAKSLHTSSNELRESVLEEGKDTRNPQNKQIKKTMTCKNL